MPGHRRGTTGQYSVREAGTEVDPGHARVSNTVYPRLLEGGHHASVNNVEPPMTSLTGIARSSLADTVLSTTE